MATRIRMVHQRKRYSVYIKDGKVRIKKALWGFLYLGATDAEREIVARQLGYVLSEIWPHALKGDVRISLQKSYQQRSPSS